MKLIYRLNPLCRSIAILLLGVTSNIEVHAHGDAHEDTTLDLESISLRNVNVFTADIVREAPPALINPSVGGQWSAVQEWPLVAIHAALLPNGKVLAWDATPDDSDDDPHTTDNYTTRVTLWDPLSDTHTETNNDTDTDLFCAGSAHLWDGRILFAGGDGGRAGANGPLANSNIYNPVTNTWHRTENMNAPRWYSSVAALSNGEMLTLGGDYNPSPLAEVFQFDQTWRALEGEYPRELTEDYQWLQQTPEGSVLSFGPLNVILEVDTNATGNIAARTTRDSVDNRSYGSYAMYTTGKIIVSGGADGLNSAVIIDTATKQTTDTSPMSHGRRQHNLTLLADGKVLATGGNSDGAVFYSPTAPVFTPELWDPETGLWTDLNIIPSDRQYHSIAILLADGRVLSAGGGICGDCYALGYEEKNAEIFSPPYLFNSDGSLADRPALTFVPENANYDQQLAIGLSSSSAISKAHLIKLGSVTHSENQDQRLIPLEFEESARRLSLNMPSSRNVAPPGHYLLFVVDENGVPSIGAMLKLGQPLVGEQQLVRSTLEQNALDTYLTGATQEAISIELNAQPGTLLRVAENTPNIQTNNTGALCSVTAGSDGRAVCEMNLATRNPLHIALSGANRSDYTLIYRNIAPSITTVTPSEPTLPVQPITTVENLIESTPITPITPVSRPNSVDQSDSGQTNGATDVQNEAFSGVGVVRTGGGSWSAISFLVLLICGFQRAFSSVRRVG